MKFGEEIGTRCLRRRKLSNQAESLVNIKIDDHGRAILTFTIVTIIFLPLSFVCGDLRMNMVDIHSTKSTQSLFWYTALPLASVLMLTAWTLAFQAHRLRQMYRSVRFHTVSRISQWVNSRSGRKLLRCERDSTQI